MWTWRKATLTYNPFRRKDPKKSTEDRDDHGYKHVVVFKNKELMVQE